VRGNAIRGDRELREVRGLLARKYRGGGTPTVRPEPVEGLSFLLPGQRKGEGFDKLSPNGFGVLSLALPILP
jgi:hypothetical protein